MTQEREKTLATLLEGVEVLHLDGDRNVAVHAVRHDSRVLEHGDLFVAMDGQKLDGHAFLMDVARRGASAAVVTRPPSPDIKIPAWIQVKDGREALARIAANFQDHPSLSMNLVGITGTNGKTTLTYLLESILRAAGARPGVIGTVDVRYGEQVEKTEHTTPEADVLQAILARMRDAACSHVLMETSSHALELQRSRACDFRVAVFTNLSRDHLDFHGDLESYAAAKRLLFSRELVESRAADKWAVFNADDSACGDMVAAWPGQRILFGRSPEAQVRPVGDVSMGLEGLRAELLCGERRLRLESPLIGAHNLENLLAAVAVAHCLGITSAQIEKGLRDVDCVPGRLERVSAPGRREPPVFVDYAHTDHALVNVLAALKPLTPGRLITVFGCGGDRDQGKRPLMGAAVARGADLAIVTSDNPRSENPETIIQQILPGLEGEGWRKREASAMTSAPAGVFAVEADRRRAIGLAVAAARQGDVVLLAGKGHETTQTVGHERFDFDDRVEAARALAECDEVSG